MGITYKEFFMVRRIDTVGTSRYVSHGHKTYEEAFDKAKSYEMFQIMSYTVRVLVEPVYEYLVVFKNNSGQFDMTLKEYYVSKEEFESDPTNIGWTCVELVQSTKRERKE